MFILVKMNNNSIWTKGFIFACIGCFLLFANFYMLLSAMPLAVKQLLNGSAKDMSLIVSIYLLGIVVLRPFSGLLADRFGKRRVSLITILFFAICSLAYFGINAILPLLLIRFVHGLFHSTSTTAHAAMAIDMLPIEKKGEGIGYYGLAMSSSMVLGPALGLLLLNNYGYKTLIIVAGLFSLLSLLFTFLIEERTNSENAVKPNVSFSLINLIEIKAIPVCLSALFFSFSYSSLISFVAIYTKEIGLASAGMYFFISLASAILLTRPAVGKLLDRKGPSFLMFPGLLLFSLGIAALSMGDSVGIILCIGFILGVAYGAIFPSFQTITVRLSPADRSGAATATFFLFYDTGFGLGAFVLAIIANSFGYSVMFQVVSLLTLFSLFLYYFLYYRKSRVS